MNKNLFIIILYILFSAYTSLGQHFYSRNYTINNGLPDNCIRDIYKDSRGFLWLGTDAGLSKFNGKDFTLYTIEDGLAGDKIWSITETEEGNIWVGSHNGGISKLDGNKIISYNTESGLISNDVRKIFYSFKFKILLIGTEDGLSVFKDNSFISFHKKLNNVNQRLQVTNFIENKDFIYVFTNGNGLYKYIPAIESLIRVPSDNKLNSYLLSSAYISSIGDTLVNFKRNSILSITKKSQTVTDNIGQIMSYTEDNEKNIWIAAWDNNYVNAGGLFKFDSTGITNFGKYLDIKSRNILSLEFDSKENLLWIGTKEDGLYLYPLTNFSYYNAEDFNLLDLNILDLNTDSKNNLWIVSNKDIIKKNPNGTFKIYPFDLFNNKFSDFIKNTAKTKYKYLNDPNGSFEKYNNLISSGLYPFANPYKRLDGIILPASSLYKPLKYDVLVNKKLTGFNKIIFDTNSNIWIGSNTGIFKIDANTDQIKYFDLEGNQFSSFTFDKDNKLYAINWADLFIYPNIRTSSNYYLYNHYDTKSPINITKIKTQQDRVWFISDEYGLYIYNDSKFYSSLDNKSLNNISFNDICFDSYGNVILGGNNGKIYITDFYNDSIRTKIEIDNKKGLLGKSIRWLNCTKENILIAGTNSGLNLIDLNKLYTTGSVYINKLNEYKGFTDYTGNSAVVQDDNKLWIGSNANLTGIDLKKLENENARYISFFIESITINDEYINLEDNENFDAWTNIPTSTITLPYYKNSITFNFDAIEYLDPANISFSYKLEGYHQNWIKDTKDRKIVFQNLKPGKFRLRVKLVNDSNKIANQELSISFIILSPIYYKWWFICICIGFLLFIIWLIVYLRTKSVKRKEQQRAIITEKMSEFEMKALRAQMNPHFIFNAINSIQNYMLDSNIDAALNYLSDFAKLIRLTLDNVSKKRISLDEELNYLKYYLNLEQMRFDKVFETQIILPPEFENSKIIIPAMILQPYIENSIKHGFVFKENGGKIKLEFQITNDNFLKCIIEDNGIGRKKAQELNKSKKDNKSKGTFITNERLSLLNQTQPRKGYKVEIIDLYDKYDLACGTRVEIFIPL